MLLLSKSWARHKSGRIYDARDEFLPSSHRVSNTLHFTETDHVPTGESSLFLLLYFCHRAKKEVDVLVSVTHYPFIDKNSGCVQLALIEHPIP
jgi:hypothetical protein